jgi:hypothetical protein
VDDDTLKRAIMILATVVAFLLASRLAARLVDQPDLPWSSPSWPRS